MAETLTPTTSGPALGAIANGLVSLHKATCGKGPIDAVAHATGDTIVCVMHGGLTLAERTLLDEGHENLVRRQRDALHQAMRPKAKALVEHQLGRAVETVLFATEPADEVEAFIFVLARDDSADGEG